MADLPPPPVPQQTEIIVTAKALSDPASEQAYGVEVLDRDALGRSASSQLDEMLKQVPGLQLFRRSDSHSSHPTSQGVTMRALGGNASSRALLTLDGIPQADPFGGWVNWPAFDPAGLAEVRVIRGGGSVAHGPGALAGVIALTSDLSPGLHASLAAGSRDSVEGQVRAATALGGAIVGATARAERGDGFIPIAAEFRGAADRPAHYRNGTIRLFSRAPLGDALHVQMAVSAFSDRRDRGLAFTGNETKGADASIRLVGQGSIDWSAAAYAQLRKFESSFASVSPDRRVANRVSLQYDVPSHAVGGSIEVRPSIAGVDVRIGADARTAEGHSNELFSYVDGQPTRHRRAGGTTLTSGAFAEATARLGPATFSGGARIDHWRISSGVLREHVIATGGVLRDDVFPQRDGWLPTARVGLVLDGGKALSFRSAAYLGWRMPTLNELFRPFRAGADATAANPLLDPERLAGIEAGVDYRKQDLTVSATLFVNRLSNGIANVTLGSGPGIFPGVGFVGAGGEYRQRQNINGISSAGFEGAAEWRVGAWSFQASASLVDATVSADGPASPLSGLRPAQTPRVGLTGGVEWQSGRRIASLLLRHVGSQFEDDLNRRRLSSALTVDGMLGWPLSRQASIEIRGTNLLDAQVSAGIAADGTIERAAPRTLMVGIRFQSPR